MDGGACSPCDWRVGLAGTVGAWLRHPGICMETAA